MRIVYFGSGAFGLPTLELLARRHDVTLIVSQPDRPAGRGRRVAPTPIAEWTAERSGGTIPLIRPDNVNAPEVVERIAEARADALVVIAFGQKIGPAILHERFAVNLHGSLLPRHRGAAPVNWTILAGDSQAGVTAITLAQRMDAGAILGAVPTEVSPSETAGELHDRLSVLGAPLIAEVLRRQIAGTLVPVAQDEAAATRAPKLSRRDAWIRFDAHASEVRRRIHGLSPWPGVTAKIGERQVRLVRVEEAERKEVRPGQISADGAIACGVGSVRLIEVQPPGKRVMTWVEFLRGHPIATETAVESVVSPPPA